METLGEIIFEDGEFSAGVARKALPYLSSRQRAGYTTTGLYYSWHSADGPWGTVVISHGFSEGMYKYREMVYVLLKSGLNCLAYEHRGHGRSVRVTGKNSSVHIDTFHTYTEDLEGITREVALPLSKGLPLFLLGHSMGGCVAALVLEDFPYLFKAAVLSSPMLAIRMKPGVPRLARLVAAAACAFGKSEEEVGIFSGKERFEDSCSTSRERWDHQRNIRENNVLLRLENPTWGWLKSALRACSAAVGRAGSIEAPTLVFQSETDKLVDTSSYSKFSRANSLVRVRMMPGTKHEIMSAPKDTLLRYYGEMLTFFKENS